MRKELSAGQKKKKEKGICITNRCMKPSAKNKSYCHCCISKRYRANNPEMYAYSNLKQNAKKRGKEFDLSFEDFTIFLKKNPNYMRKKGTSIKALQIDRIAVNKGYTLDNIQAITLAENVWKQHNIDYQMDDPMKENYCPF